MPLDLNAATADQLDAIPSLSGHGPEIVRYRQLRGTFANIRQLDEVPGLSGKVGDDASAALTIGG